MPQALIIGELKNGNSHLLICCTDEIHENNFEDKIKRI